MVCSLMSWNYNTTNAFPNSTWREVAIPGAGDGYADGYYSEAYIDDQFPGSVYGLSFTPFQPRGVTMQTYAKGWVVAGVMFNESFTTSETLAIALNYGGGIRRINTINGALGDLFYMVSGPTADIGIDVGHASEIVVEAWHNSASAKTIRDASLSVYAAGLLDSSLWTSY